MDVSPHGLEVKVGRRTSSGARKSLATKWSFSTPTQGGIKVPKSCHWSDAVRATSRTSSTTQTPARGRKYLVHRPLERAVSICGCRNLNWASSFDPTHETDLFAVRCGCGRVPAVPHSEGEPVHARHPIHLCSGREKEHYDVIIARMSRPGPLLLRPTSGSPCPHVT